MELTLEDSRRLTGANILSDHPGAVIDVTLREVDPTEVVRIWKKCARQALEAVGWATEETFARIFPGGASLALSAPIDALYAATEVNEWAWTASVALIEGRDLAPEDSPERLRAAIDAERNPPLLRLMEAANERGLLFLSDDDFASVGMGTGAHTWRVGDLPAPRDVDWSAIHDIPTVMITGSNGKTTTVRLLAAIARTCGYETGHTCTDGIFLNGEMLEAGDYSGPGGARKLVRNNAVTFAVLETARGGMLRRGLGVPRADAALVTNVCDDHLGEWGAHSIEDLIEAKLVIRRAAQRGTLVVNAEDRALARRALPLQQDVAWIASDSDNEIVTRHVRSGGAAAIVDGGMCKFLADGLQHDVVPVRAIPITVEGHARHNVLNVLAAIALARAVSLPFDGIRDALTAFGADRADNRGRTNFYHFGGLRVLVDFAHNPHGANALMDMVRAMAAKRRMVMIGQAGDRDDDAIRDLTSTMVSCDPDLVVVKEMDDYLRGRRPGEATDIIVDHLRQSGFPEERIVRAQSEIEAVRYGLSWARNGDFMVLPVLQERTGVIELLEMLEKDGWQPGNALPEPDRASGVR